MPTAYSKASTTEAVQSASSTARLFPEEATVLLQTLVQQRWRRLSSEYHDPLGMLFGNRARQWTAGWDPTHQNLYLLIWETDSWQEKPVWSLYQDGALIFQEEEGFSKTRDSLFHQLLEGQNLPFLTQSQFLAPLVEFHFSPEQRQQTAQVLIQTFQTRPEVFDTLKAPLLEALERDFGNAEWPLLDILKLHRVAHKTLLVNLFRQCVQHGLIRTEKELQRLDGALNQLQTEFTELGQRISNLFMPALQASRNELKAIVTQGTWRVRLAQSHTTPLSGAHA